MSSDTDVTGAESEIGTRSNAPNLPPQAELDPVCGMKIDPSSAMHLEYSRKTYFFCSSGCAAKFREMPEKNIQPKMATAKPATPVTPAKTNGYTCPMHPEVHRDDPGDCPKCGMALERETLTAPPISPQYTCPMHHRLVRDEPGNCPICGMTLERITVTVNEANPELDSMTRRFWIAAALTPTARHHGL